MAIGYRYVYVGEDLSPSIQYYLTMFTHTPCFSEHLLSSLTIRIDVLKIANDVSNIENTDMKAVL